MNDSNVARSRDNDENAASTPPKRSRRDGHDRYDSWRLHDPLNLQYASSDTRSNRQLVMAAVTKRWSHLRYASDKLKNDKEIVIAAVKNNGSALQFASYELTNDREVVKLAVENNDWALLNVLQMR